MKHSLGIEMKNLFPNANVHTAQKTDSVLIYPRIRIIFKTIARLKYYSWLIGRTKSQV